MTDSHSARVDRLFSRDRILALGFVAVLWVTLLFVFFSISSVVDSTAIRVVLAIAGAVVLIFNTASIVAMIRHYGHDKEEIYGIDIRHQDALKQMKVAERQRRRAEGYA